MRADFFAEALSYRPLADALQDAQVNLAAMDEEELRAAIEKPAANYNVCLEEGLSQRLIDAVLESPSNLPLLEFTLTQLWEKQHDGWLTHKAYEEIGGVETALANHAESIYSELIERDRERVQQIFIQLVQPSERSADIRRLAIREEVGDWDLVTRLADGRLVVTNRNQVTGVETVEIVHETLIKNWRRLQKWMREDGEFRYWQEQLRVFIRQWERSDKDDGALLRGKPLIDAKEWLSQRLNQLSTIEQNFISLSLELRRKEAREKKQARRRVIVWLVGGLFAALILAGIAEFQSQQAEYQRQNSEINQIKSLSLTAKTLLNSGNQVEALNSTLEANNKLIELRDNLDIATKTKLFSSLLENVNSIREYNILSSHDSQVNSVSFSDNGKLLASGSQDNTIKIWQRDGKLLQTLTERKDGFFSVIFSPNNKFLIAGSFDNTVSLWRYNSATGLFSKNPVVTISEPEELWAIGFNPNNNIIATATENGKVKFWNLSGKLIKTISAHNQKIWGLNFSQDGKYFATASADNTINIWDREGRFLKTLRGHEDEVLSVNFSPDNKFIVSGSKDKTVKLWDLTGKFLHTFEGHTNDVLDVRFSPDGKLIASASADNTVRIWNVSLKEEYQRIKYGSKAIEVKFSPDGKTLATASEDKTVKLRYLKGILPTFTGNSVSISPDGETVAIANGNTVTLRRRNYGLKNRRDAESAEERGVEELSVVLQGGRGNGKEEYEIIKVIFSPTGKYFATIDSENQIKVWNLQGKVLRQWQGHDLNKNNFMGFDAIQDIDISPDGKKIATISRIHKQVKLWNSSGKLIKNWQLNDDFVTSIKFSPDGKTLAIAEDENVTLWNLKGNLLHTF
ncbi:MAG: WD40 repeat domain-containing protein, partial [Cyanobacteriota bacterium]|nr:WD40 repeat domain-containing protein [Cyanobacteriota bacterium]